jgi:hypothetical protein
MAGIVFAFVCNNPSHAQVGIGTTAFTPNASSGLHINFPDKGLLLPQVDLTTYLTTVASGSQGLMVYNTSLSLPGGAGLYLNTSSSTTPSWFKIPGIYAGSEAENYVAIWGAGSNLKGDPNFYWDDASNLLGIGTTAPTEQLTLTRNIDLPNSTATTGIIKKEGQLFIHNYGTENTFIGISAGNLTTSGFFNVGVGDGTLGPLDSGSDNTAVGDYAMSSNTDGYNNIAFGSGSLASNTTGSYSIGIGTFTLGTQVDDGGDPAICNIAIGFQAMYDNNPTSSTNGRKNVGIGYMSLTSNLTGANNVAVGHKSLMDNTTGTDNVAVGYQAGIGSTGLSNTIAIGSGVTATASNEVRLGNSGITSLYCQGAYAATTSNAANLYVDINGKIMRSTAKGPSGGNVGGQDAEISDLKLRLEEKDREIANIKAELEELKAIVAKIAAK